MNVTYLCPTCEQAVRAEIPSPPEPLTCPACGTSREIEPGSISAGGIVRCLVCPSSELFVRKDFPQRLGVGLVVLGIVASSIAWGMRQVAWAFGVLFATALADVALYLLVGDSLMCYRCGAQYRGQTNDGRHGQFNLETHERYRQIAARGGPGA